MPVYIDSANIIYGRMIMCHMFADSTAELTAMAKRIGISTKHIQHAGTSKEHFDICLTKKKIALSRGATEIDNKQVYKLINRS